MKNIMMLVIAIITIVGFNGVLNFLVNTINPKMKKKSCPINWVNPYAAKAAEHYNK